MASTFRAMDAFDYSKRLIKNMPIESIQTQILDNANKYLWMAGPWRWTLGSFPSIAMVANTQDYTVTLPADFLYIYDSYLTDQTTSIPRVLSVEPYLVSGGKPGQPSEISVVSGVAGGSGTVRFSPAPGTVATGLTAITRYKKVAPVLQPNNLNTVGTLVFDDEWFWVYNSGVLYEAYLFGDDNRAGSAQIDPGSGKVTFSGQRGVFEANIALMKERETLPRISGVVEAQKEKV